jgi:hypothetical protein
MLVMASIVGRDFVGENIRFTSSNVAGRELRHLSCNHSVGGLSVDGSQQEGAGRQQLNGEDCGLGEHGDGVVWLMW